MYSFLISTVTCQPISSPGNGVSTCSTGASSIGDNCVVTCNDGYGVQGDGVRTCQNNGTWSGTEAVCTQGQFTVSRILVSILSNDVKV